MDKRRIEEIRASAAKAKGIGCDGFDPKVHLDLTKETREKSLSFWRRWIRVGSGRNKLVQRCSS